MNTLQQEIQVLTHSMEEYLYQVNASCELYKAAVLIGHSDDSESARVALYAWRAAYSAHIRALADRGYEWDLNLTEQVHRIRDIEEIRAAM